MPSCQVHTWCAVPLACVQVAELTEEQKEYLAKMSAEKEAAAPEDVEARGPTTFFHGKADKDYQVSCRGSPSCWACGCAAGVQESGERDKSREEEERGGDMKDTGRPKQRAGRRRKAKQQSVQNKEGL